VSPLDEIPAPWRDAMENAGTYSLRDLAARAEVGTSTVSDLIYGRKLTSERTIASVADSLRLPVTTIREWAAAARGEERPFELPPEANRLGRRQREAVLAVVRAMLDPVEEKAPISGPEPATVHDYALAARRGPSEGRRLRTVQDEQNEVPDEDPGFPES